MSQLTAGLPSWTAGISNLTPCHVNRKGLLALMARAPSSPSASKTPHPQSAAPETGAQLERALAHVSEDDKEAVRDAAAAGKQEWPRGTGLFEVSQMALQVEARRWRRDRDVVEAKLVRANLLAAAFGLGGTLGAVAQNELIFNDLDPVSLEVMLAKGLTSLLCLLCVLFVYRVHWMRTLHERLVEHLRRCKRFDDNVSLSHVLRRPLFWLEAFVCLVHCPPYITGEISNESIGNVVVYRYETIACAVAVSRFYLVSRALVDSFLAELPDSKLSISTFSGIKFDAAFCIKKLLTSWKAFKVILGLWISVIVVGGYLFRLSETTSCLQKHSTHPDCNLPSAREWSIAGNTFTKVNDLYYFNAFWFVSTSITPGGGGNIVAATHLGRFVAAVSVIAGVFLQSLTTAALGHLLVNSPAEYTALGMMRRESYRIQLQRDAANIICLWWRRRCHPQNLSQRQRKRARLGLSGYRGSFVTAQNMAKVEVEECASMSTKIDQIAGRTKELLDVFDDIGENILVGRGSGSLTRNTSSLTLSRASDGSHSP
jgi:hypothetical protein